jgi:hypothetical protein
LAALNPCLQESQEVRAIAFSASFTVVSGFLQAVVDGIQILRGEECSFSEMLEETLVVYE